MGSARAQINACTLNTPRHRRGEHTFHNICYCDEVALLISRRHREILTCLGCTYRSWDESVGWLARTVDLEKSHSHHGKLMGPPVCPCKRPSSDLGGSVEVYRVQPFHAFSCSILVTGADQHDALRTMRPQRIQQVHCACSVNLQRFWGANARICDA